LFGAGGQDDDPGSWGFDRPPAGAAPRPVRPAAPVPAARPQPVPPGRSREAVRATCALAAATWSQGRADVDAQDLIGIAELLHTWVTDAAD
jgi:hypothetical protein